MASKRYLTVIAKKLHDLLAENGIHPIKSDVNRNNPVYTVWKYEVSTELEQIRQQYIEESHKNQKEY